MLKNSQMNKNVQTLNKEIDMMDLTEERVIEAFEEWLKIYELAEPDLILNTTSADLWTKFILAIGMEWESNKDFRVRAEKLVDGIKFRLYG